MNDLDISALEPVNNPDKNRFEIRFGKQVAMIEYMIQGKTIIMSHTEVPPAFEGKGLASKLAKFALDWAKAEGYKVNPVCPYVKGYIRKHPEYEENSW